MPIFKYDNQHIEYVITRNRPNQKNVILRVRDGAIHVSAPKHVNAHDIEKFMQANRAWITTKLKEQQNRHTNQTDSQCKQLTTCYFHGQLYHIQIVPVPTIWPGVKLENDTMVVSFPSSKLDFTALEADEIKLLHQTLYAWFRDEAKQFIPNYVMSLGNTLSLHPRRVLVKEQKSRWGSCSTNGSIYMNWRLIQAPPAVLHYVAIHELAHLQEHNHSLRFWQIVGTHMPDYEVHKDWLKHHGTKLFKIHKP